MIAVMARNKKWNFFAFPALADAFDAMSPDYGEKSLHGNVAVAVFLLLKPAERDRMITLVQAAKRIKNGRGLLENMRTLAFGIPPLELDGVPPAGPSLDVNEEISDVLENLGPLLGDVPPDKQSRPGRLLISGTAAISLGLSYAWWCQIRVWRLRQDFFDIRDRLWDAMRAKGLLHDPHHLREREKINDLIRFAPLLSMATLLAAVIVNDGASEDALPGVPSKEITEAETLVARRMMSYLLSETSTGLAIQLVVRIVVSSARTKKTLFGVFSRVVAAGRWHQADNHGGRDYFPLLFCAAVWRSGR